MEINVQQVVIKRRVRKNLGDLSHLMNSMRHHGLLNPILITDSNELIAGHRRLEAAKRLGWQKIEARIYSRPSRTEKLELELNENLYRKDFTEEELAEGYTRLDRMKHPSIWKRFWLWLQKIFRRIFNKSR